MEEIIFCGFYLLIFSFIIIKARLFKLDGVNGAFPILAFYLKLVFGLALWYIYTYHYKNRYTADIFKYFDDARYMYGTIHHSIHDFFKMLFGIDDQGQKIQGYYHSMASWVNGHDSTIYNNSHFIIRLNAILLPLSQGYYSVHVLFFCFLSFTGMVFLYKAFYPLLAEKAFLLFASIFLFPSTLLWSSGILKEGLVFLGLGLSIYYFRKLINKLTFSYALLFVVGILLIYEVKAYVLLCILPGFIAETLISRVPILTKRPWLTYTAVVVIYMGIGLNVNMINQNINPLQNLADKQREFKRLVKGGIYLAQADSENLYAYIPAQDSAEIMPLNHYADSLLHTKGIQYLTTAGFCYMEEATKKIAPFKLTPHIKYTRINSTHGGDTLALVSNDSITYRLDTYIEPAKSAVDIPTIEPNIFSLLKAVPNALVISVIRPFPNEIKSGAVLIYFFENLAILFFIIIALVCIKKQNKHTNMVAFCVSYCLLMLVLIGLSTPLYGGIERYKSVVIPFMLILLLLIYDKDKFRRILKLKNTTNGN